MSTGKQSTTVADPAKEAAADAEYRHSGCFSRDRFRDAFTAEFASDGHFDAAAVPAAEDFLGLIERDGNVTDIRAMAYMMATVFWETTSLKKELVQAKDRKGKPLVDKKGKPVMRTKRQWAMTMAPVGEAGKGKGRRYELPVKVKKLADGSVRVTEQDGDQFLVDKTGGYSRVKKGAKLGVTVGAAATKVYKDDDGVELTYYGRGYVQLTWWSNYAATGAAIGRGLDLLLDPDLALDEDVAYAVLSNGMRTGSGFANGRTFSRYFRGTHTDYTNARRMVNGTDHADDIAAIAKKFETVLFKSVADPTTATAQR